MLCHIITADYSTSSGYIYTPADLASAALIYIPILPERNQESAQIWPDMLKQISSACLSGHSRQAITALLTERDAGASLKHTKKRYTQSARAQAHTSRVLRVNGTEWINRPWRTNQTNHWKHEKEHSKHQLPVKANPIAALLQYRRKHT